MEKDIPCNQKRTKMAILISNRKVFKSKFYKGQRTLYNGKRFNSPRRYNNLKCIHIRTELHSKYRKQKLTETMRKNKFTITEGDFNNPFSLINRTNRQRIIKDVEELNRP